MPENQPFTLEDAETLIRELTAKGLVRSIGTTSEGEVVYGLTDKGRRTAEKILAVLTAE